MPQSGTPCLFRRLVLNVLDAILGGTYPEEEDLWALYDMLAECTICSQLSSPWLLCLVAMAVEFSFRCVCCVRLLQTSLDTATHT